MCENKLHSNKSIMKHDYENDGILKSQCSENTTTQQRMLQECFMTVKVYSITIEITYSLDYK